MLIIGLIVSIIGYIVGIRYGAYLLDYYDIEISGFMRWIVLNLFAIIISSIVALPFPSII